MIAERPCIISLYTGNFGPNIIFPHRFVPSGVSTEILYPLPSLKSLLKTVQGEQQYVYRVMHKSCVPHISLLEKTATCKNCGMRRCKCHIRL
jgi:hypothetical protein